MFTQKTTFILGAGASWHYGYPTGEDLVNLIIIKAREIENFFKGVELQWPFWPKIADDEQKAHFPNTNNADALVKQAVFKKIASDCNDLAKRLDHVKPLVIDFFLGQNPNLQKIGKFLIAHVILDLELEHYHPGSERDTRKNINRRKALLQSPKMEDQRDARDIDIGRYGDAWVRFIIHRLAANPERLLENEVTFVTFNYDVSLERSLFTALSNIERFNSEHIHSFLSEERILHVYGKVHKDFDKEQVPLEKIIEGTKHSRNGRLPLDNYEERHAYLHYKQQILDKVYESIDQISTIDDVDQDRCDKQKQQEIQNLAKTKIKEADIVYILGFGFDEKNCERIGLQALAGSNSGPERKIYFTNFQNKNLINKKASRLFLKQPDLFLPPNFIQKRSMSLPIFQYYEKSVKDVYGALESDFDFL